MVGIIEWCTERRGEEPVGQLLPVPLAPLGPLIADPTCRQPSGEPFDDRTARRPGVGLQRRHGHRRPLDRLGHADSCVGRVEITPHRVGVVRLGPHRRLEPGQRFRHDECVLDQRAHVVVDVHDRRQLGAPGEAHGNVDVVTVAEDMDHLADPEHLGLAEPSEPLGQPVTTPGQLAADARREEVVTAELGDDGEQRRGLDPIHVEEHVDEFAPASTAAHPRADRTRTPADRPPPAAS